MAVIYTWPCHRQ